MMSFPNVVLPGDGPMPYADVGARSSSRPSRGPISLDPRRLGRADRRQGRPHRRRCAARDRRRAPTPSSSRTTADGSSTACTATLRVLPEVVAAVERPDRGPARRRHPPRQRRRQGALPRRPRGPDRPRVRVRPRRRRRPRCRARDRDPAADVMRTMKLLGCPTVTALNESYIDVPMEWSATPRHPKAAIGSRD